MTIEEYNKEWTEWFYKIKNILVNNLSKIIEIEHVGSTSIIGMCAKPIIDIDIIIKNVNDFEIAKHELELLGYYHNGDQGIIGREAFNRNDIIFSEILDNIKHHLYVCDENNIELKRHIFFRNYLNNNKRAKQEYYNIKKEIISKIGNNDRKKYQNIKETEYNEYFKRIYKIGGFEY